MSNLRDRGHFEAAYAGKAPWDIGKPRFCYSSLWTMA